MTDQHSSTEQNNVNQPALEMTGITLAVQDGEKKRIILDDIHLHINAGEVVGLVGPSGSGKSTLLSIAGCLQDADHGKALLHSRRGTDIALTSRGAAAAKIRREHIGIVFQQANLLPSLTVKQQLMAMRRLGRVFGWGPEGRKGAEQKALELLEAVGLDGMENRRVSQLSGGQQARVNIARALMNSPEILLVDEPTAALDQSTAKTITQLIMRVTKEMGVGTLYITHDEGQLRGADRLVRMTDGKLVNDQMAGEQLQPSV